MKPLQIAALAATIFNISLTLLVLRSQFRAKTSLPYTVWGISLTLWNLGAFFLMGPLARESQWLWELVLQVGVIFLPLSLWHFCVAISGRNWTRLWVLLYLIHAGFAASLFNGWFISDVRQYSFGYWGVPGPIFWLYLLCYGAESTGILVTLARSHQKAGPTERAHLKLMLAATFVMIFFGANDLLPIIGYDHYPGTLVSFVPMGNLAAVLYAIIIAYSLLQHQFLNVHVSLSRATAQAVRLIFVFVIEFILLLTIATFAPPRQFTTFSFVAALFTVLASALIASLVFPRLFGKGDDTLERRILGDRFEYQDRVRGFIESMIWYHDLESLLDDLQDLTVNIFRIGSYRIILRDETNQVFSVFRAHPADPLAQLPELKIHSPVFQYFEWGKAEYLIVNPKYARPGERLIERQAREQLGRFNAEFCFPLASQNEPFGLFLVGAKINDTPFTATDINLLVSLVKNMSLMVNQIRLKSQILQTQELDLLGRMSRGMAHDLNNLLTPVWTLLQLSGESGDGFDEELLPVAQRNIKTMRAYIKEALFFSENLRLDLQLGRFDLVIQHAVDLARASRNKKEVEVVSVTPGEVLAEMDEVLIQRLIANLISNALDASRSGTQIHVHLDRLPRPGEPDWLRLRVVDQGEGIPKENLSRILKPYFTTKNRGDETRGFGLGLAICRKIVNLHGGNLSIASVVKKGTTVQVDLPSRQPRPAASPLAVSA